MKKLFTFLALQILFFSVVHAQIPNASFESWTTTGGYSIPDGWDNFNSLTASMGVYTCEKGTTGAPHGSSFLMLTNKMVGTKVVPGLAMSGKYDFVNMEPKSGFPFTGRPKSLTGKWQYMASGTDVGRVAVYLTKWNATTNATEVVGEAKYDLPGMVMSWTPFSIPINYMSGATPDSALIAFVASNSGATVGSYLYVDSLNFFGTVVGIDRVEYSKYDVNLSPNPAKDNLFIDLGTIASNDVQLSVMDLYGRTERKETLLSGKHTYSIDLNNIAKGLYFVKIDIGANIQTQQLVIQ